MRLLVGLLVALSAASVEARTAKRPAKAAAKAPLKPVVELMALNTHELFRLRPDAKGHFGNKELHGWNRFLRCHHTGRVHQMASHLADLLYEVGRHWEGKRIEVVAGYRAPRVARQKGNPRSPHKKGVACDFRVDGVVNTELRDFVRSAFNKVGVGYYPNSEFVHLDVGRKVSAFWIDYSKPGERAKYSKTPEQDLAVEAAAADEEAGGTEPHLDSAPGASTPQNSDGGVANPRED